MSSLFAPAPSSLTWFESRQRQRTLDKLRNEIERANAPDKRQRHFSDSESFRKHGGE